MLTCTCRCVFEISLTFQFNQFYYILQEFHSSLSVELRMQHNQENITDNITP